MRERTVKRGAEAKIGVVVQSCRVTIARGRCHQVKWELNMIKTDGSWSCLTV
jgi:hypothetical protein